MMEKSKAENARPRLSGGIKTLLDFLPLLVFFIAFRFEGLFEATLALLVATLVSTCIFFLYERRIATVPLLTMLSVLIFGGATLFFDDPRFIKMKPTIVQLIFAGLLAGSAVMGKPFAKYILADNIRLSLRDWYIFSLRLSGFFLFAALLNEWVWRTQSTAIWVNFKVFGLTSLTMIFFLSQMPFLIKRSLPEKTD